MNENLLFAFERFGDFKIIAAAGDISCRTLYDVIGKRCVRNIARDICNFALFEVKLKKGRLYIFSGDCEQGASCGLLISDDGMFQGKLLSGQTLTKVLMKGKDKALLSHEDMLCAFSLAAESFGVTVECVENAGELMYDGDFKAADPLFVFLVLLLAYLRYDIGKKIYMRTVSSCVSAGFVFCFEKTDVQKYSAFRSCILDIIDSEYVCFMKNESMYAVRCDFRTDDPSLIGLKYSLPVSDAEDLHFVLDDE